ncbi:MAG: hypothetical protein R2856_11965 [Caldilineaceae bacterium]
MSDATFSAPIAPWPPDASAVIVDRWAALPCASPHSRQNIWWDEARNIEVALRPFGQIAGAPELDIQPPLYFWLPCTLEAFCIRKWVWTWRLMPLGRFLSVAAGSLASVLVFVLTRRIAGPRAGTLALSIVAVLAVVAGRKPGSAMYTLSFTLLTAAAMAWVGIWGSQDLGTDSQRSGIGGWRWG